MLVKYFIFTEHLDFRKAFNNTFHDIFEKKKLLGSCKWLIEPNTYITINQRKSSLMLCCYAMGLSGSYIYENIFINDFTLVIEDLLIKYVYDTKYGEIFSTLKYQVGTERLK